MSNEGFHGRKIDLEWGGAAIGGIREKSVELNGSPVDVTSDDDLGWRKLLLEAGENQVNLSCNGITKTSILKRDWFLGANAGGASARTKTMTLEYPDGSILSGEFYLATYKDTGPYKDATTFEASFQSTGAVVFLPYS